MDMYVCATAKSNPIERINILYVNQGIDKNGIPVFKDMAKSMDLLILRKAPWPIFLIMIMTVILICTLG